MVKTFFLNTPNFVYFLNQKTSIYVRFYRLYHFLNFEIKILCISNTSMYKLEINQICKFPKCHMPLSLKNAHCVLPRQKKIPKITQYLPS